MAKGKPANTEQLQGVITFIHHDKRYATIDYDHNGKKKSITARLIDEKGATKPQSKHIFRIGDAVKFETRPSLRGEKMVAANLKYLYNTSLEILINKAKVENRFAGFLKEVDGQLYIKERDSYIFFPLRLSKWENPPADSAYNDVISFKLANIDKPHALVAELFSHDFIPAYRKAMEHFRNRKSTEAIVSKVSPFAVYLNLFGGEIVAKMSTTGQNREVINMGDRIEVKITHLTASRIVIVPVE